ncbi:MAG: Prolipoprotein diacylglyceryl transferase [Bacteroidetes bacterium ADurb.Bin234]|nr:MAG: Prolipoprotein diacylglyceryl transferase [Bacteroidetes bacterium ADurb.Bin234]
MLTYITWNVDPILFQLGSLRVGWYGVLLASGFLLAYLVFQKMLVKEGLPQDITDRFAVYTILWTVVGLRIGHCLFYDWAYFSNHILEIFIPFTQTPQGWQFTGYAGLASHGGVIAIILFVIYYSYKHKINILWLLDRMSIAVPIAAAFVRCGNLMNSEIIGVITDKPWGFIFTQLEGTDECCEPRHPTQLYEAFVYFSLFLFHVWYYFKHTKGKIYAGRTTGILLIVIFTARFLIEFVKKEQVDFEVGMTLNMGQWLSIPFIILGIFCLYYSYKKKFLFVPKQANDNKKKA